MRDAGKAQWVLSLTLGDHLIPPVLAPPAASKLAGRQWRQICACRQRPWSHADWQHEDDHTEHDERLGLELLLPEHGDKSRQRRSARPQRRQPYTPLPRRVTLTLMWAYCDSVGSSLQAMKLHPISELHVHIECMRIWIACDGSGVMLWSARERADCMFCARVGRGESRAGYRVSSVLRRAFRAYTSLFSVRRSLVPKFITPQAFMSCGGMEGLLVLRFI